MLRGAGFEICSVSCWQSFPTNLIQNTTQIMEDFNEITHLKTLLFLQPNNVLYD